MSVVPKTYSNFQLNLFERQYYSNFHNFQSNIFRERLRIAKNLYKYDLISHFGCVNAIEFSNGGEYLVSGGDDKRVLLWNLEKAIAGKGQPHPMNKEHQSNIFCLGFNRDNSRIFSGGNDDALIVHDVEVGRIVDVYPHVKPVYGLSIDPVNDFIIATAGEDGRILFFDQRIDSQTLAFGKHRGPFHAVQFHPQDGNYLITANSKTGAAFWDIRKPQNPMIQYGGEGNQQSCMSIRFNTLGNQVLVLRRRLPPILYNTFSQTPVCQFYHSDYYNSCTMKSCCFAGEDDEFVLSGSDDFNLYVWRVGDVDCDLYNQWIENTQMVLYGHRSIVNQVRYNPQKCLLASSGVEKVIKLWSPFQQKGWTGSLIDEAVGSENPREVFSHDAYFSLVHMNWANMSHDYSNQNTLEDPRMMAFFDSLIQQEIEGWNTNNTSDSDLYSVRSSGNSTRQSSTESSDEELVNYFVHTRNRNRRGAPNTTIKPQRTKYANRIAYLIATKRNTLRRLALKGASQSNRRRQNSLKHSKRKNYRSAPRTSRSGNSGKRVVRFTLMSRSRSRDEPELPKINNRYKIQNQTSLFRSFRRKNKNYQMLDQTDTSSDDDISSQTETNQLTSTQSTITNGVGSATTTNLAVPSTSSGITSNGNDVVFRLLQPSDSDDDNSPTNTDVEEQKKPLSINGVQNTNDTNIIIPPAHVSSDVDEEHCRNSTNCRKRSIGAVDLDIYSSHSNSRLSNSSYLEDEPDSSTNEKLDCFNNTTQYSVPKNNNNNNNNNKINNNNKNETSNQNNASTSLNISNNNNCSNSSPMTDVKTPNSNLKINNNNLLYTPDSGIGNMAGCSSWGSTASNHNNNDNNCLGNENEQSNDKFSRKLFHQKITRVRRNYRKKFGGDDSESD